jgi:hypothetical protein
MKIQELSIAMALTAIVILAAACGSTPSAQTQTQAAPKTYHLQQVQNARPVQGMRTLHISTPGGQPTETTVDETPATTTRSKSATSSKSASSKTKQSASKK